MVLIVQGREICGGGRGLFDIFLGYLNLTLTFSVQTQYVEALKAYHATPEYGVWNRYHVNRLKGLFVFDQFGFSVFFLFSVLHSA